MRQIEDSPVVRAMRQIEDSPVARAMRQIENSPAVQMMRQIEDSAAVQLSRSIAENFKSLDIAAGMADPAMRGGVLGDGRVFAISPGRSAARSGCSGGVP